jgi:hypothetical protein
MDQSATSDKAILDGLRKAVQALPAPLPLSGAGGVFPGGVKGKSLATRAIDQGYLTSKKEKVKAGNRSKTVEYALVTEKGVRHVVDADDPKTALEALLPAVQSLGKQPDAPNPQAFRAELAHATETCVNAIKESFARLEGQVLKALPASSAPAVGAGAILHALQSALQRVAAPVIPAAAATPPAADPAAKHSVAPARGLEEAIVAFVDGWAKEKTVGCQFDVLWNYLQKQHPNLSIGAFQDALRTLHRAGRIGLSGWPRMHDDMPRPELALFISSKVMYYAHPARPNE